MYNIIPIRTGISSPSTEFDAEHGAIPEPPRRCRRGDITIYFIFSFILFFLIFSFIFFFCCRCQTFIYSFMPRPSSAPRRALLSIRHATPSPHLARVKNLWRPAVTFGPDSGKRPFPPRAGAGQLINAAAAAAAEFISRNFGETKKKKRNNTKKKQKPIRPGVVREKNIGRRSRSTRSTEIRGVPAAVR